MSFSSGSKSKATNVFTVPTGTKPPKPPPPETGGLTPGDANGPRGGTTITTDSSGSGTPTTRPVLPATAGVFGGIQPEHTKSAEIRERLEGDARRMETLHPPAQVAGPLVMPLYELGAPLPIGEMPPAAARRFAAMAKRGRVR